VIRWRSHRIPLGYGRLQSDRGHKSVTPPWDRLNEPRIRRGVTEGLTQLTHRYAQGSVEVHKRVSRPQPLTDSLTAHDLAIILKKKEQQLKRLFLEPDAHTLPLEFAGLRIGFEDAEAIDRSGFRIFHHSDHGESGETRPKTYLEFYHRLAGEQISLFRGDGKQNIINRLPV
jgi:hypothetical protein